MNKFLYILLLLLSNNTFAQNYLITSTSWQERIKANHLLAPLFYGVELDETELRRQANFVNQEVSKYGSIESAFEVHYKLSWNYFNLGIIDTAIISFNNTYLINKNDERLIPSFGNLLCYINKDFDYKNTPLFTGPNMKLMEIFNEGKDDKNQNVMIHFGDRRFSKDLMKLHQTNKYKSLNEAIQNIELPFTLKSDGNIIIKLKQGQNEGYYKQGLKNGTWVSYFENNTQINYTYQFVNGVRHGLATSYYKNGSKKREFNFINGRIIGEHKYYNEKGKLVKVEFWKKDGTKSKKTIRY